MDYGTSVDIKNAEGQTPLHIAAAEGDEVLVKYFYGVRASASVTDNQDRTPMHLGKKVGVFYSTFNLGTIISFL